MVIDSRLPLRPAVVFGRLRPSAAAAAVVGVGGGGGSLIAIRPLLRCPRRTIVRLRRFVLPLLTVAVTLTGGNTSGQYL